ncbi:MAG TPA: OB-fold nucleic acid binding domain-containing protein, partial [Desulfuromonadales bacterium]|nr:OB-fold nucleic acid binding domain-containing protein [Desulfuromonadales bacterium]
MTHSPSYSQSRSILATPLECLRGVGPRLIEKLARLDLTTVEDLLYTLPIRYEDRREIRRIAQLQDGVDQVFYGEILSSGEAFTPKTRKKLYEVIVGDGTGRIVLKWFHYRREWMKNRFPAGRHAIISGEVKRFGSLREVHHPDIEFLAPDQDPNSYLAADSLSFGRLLPVYPLTEGLHQKTARKIWKEAVERFAASAVSPIPPSILERRRLLPLDEAIHQSHWPDERQSLPELNAGRDPARRSLVFDEFFFLELGLALRRRGIVI